MQYLEWLINIATIIVFERACNGYGRDRLTMAHELGHLLLDRVETLWREKMVTYHHIRILSGKRMHLQVNY